LEGVTEQERKTHVKQLKGRKNGGYIEVVANPSEGVRLSEVVIMSDRGAGRIIGK